MNGDIDLSRLKVLRSFQVRAWITDSRRAGFVPPSVVEPFLTITSPTFSELVITFTTHMLSYLHHPVTEFEALRKMYERIPFKLVFSLEASDPYQTEARRALMKVLDTMTAEGFLSFLDSPPTIRIVQPMDILCLY